MTEHVLTWHAKMPARTGGVPAGESGDLNLLGMPSGLVRPRRQIHAAEAMTPASRAVLDQVLATLRRFAEAPGEPERISMRDLAPADREIVVDLLGEGDVAAEVGGSGYWRVQETVLTGLWRVEARAADGTQAEWLEVATIPLAVTQAAERLSRERVDLPSQWPAGAMNAPSLIAELQERASTYIPGEQNHVVNFTLLPLTDVDADVLTAVLGQVPMVIRSEGYGSCRVFATGLKRVWAVQYLNSMSAVILDTLEVGDTPQAVLAAREDFEDSALRLAEILDAYSA
jgi:hydrogenase-1 operon protein HyaF